MTHDPRLEGDAHSAADTGETPKAAPSATDVPAPAVTDASAVAAAPEAPDAPETSATPGTPDPTVAPAEISASAPQAMPGDTSADEPAADLAADLAYDEDPALRLAAEVTRIDEPEDALPPVALTDLPPMMQEAAARAGWTNLMPVQTRALPYIFAKRDLMVQSRTGSGKTGAFLLPLLERLSPDEPAVQALILVPTRELALQVEYEARMLFEGTGLNVAAVYGGVGYGKQMDALREGAHLVVGTPGRVLDHLLRRTMNLDRIRVLVFDEADRMLSIGFYPDMKEIQRYMPKRRISAYLFSATYPPHVLNLAGEFLSDPRMLSLSHQQVHVAQTQHLYCETKPMDKDRALVRIIESENPTAAIVFCNTKANVHYVTAVLQGFGYNADELSADLTQVKREQVLGKLRQGAVRFLVATDVAARGIDIPDLSHVILYEPPEDRESYIHRAGRTGRAGSAGTVISLVDIIQKLELQRIAKHYKIDIQHRPTPDDESVARIAGDRLTALLEARLRARTGLERERQQRFAPLARALAGDEEQLALLAMLLDQYYQESLHAAPPMPATAPAPRTDRRRDERREEGRRDERDGRRDERRDDRRDARRDERDGRDGHRRGRDRRDERRDERPDGRRDERAPAVAAPDAPASAESPEHHAEPREDGQAPREGRRRSRRGRGRKRRREAEARAGQDAGLALHDGEAAEAADDDQFDVPDMIPDMDTDMDTAPVAPRAPKAAASETAETPEAPKGPKDEDAPASESTGKGKRPARGKASGRAAKASVAADEAADADAPAATPAAAAQDDDAESAPARGRRRGRGGKADAPDKAEKAEKADKADKGGKGDRAGKNARPASAKPSQAKSPARKPVEDDDDAMPLLLEDYLNEDDDDRLDDVRGSSTAVGSVFGQRLPTGAKPQPQPRSRAAAKPKATTVQPVQPVLTEALNAFDDPDDDLDDGFDGPDGGDTAMPGNEAAPAKRRRRRRRKKPAGATDGEKTAGARDTEADAE
ncbi:DEAD/DEAH box helicase [Nitratidesulfovibrio sp. HK-II]|uniref:DEAD/DEAH box helicase n=1 Tax=Nitratidesulfovibrio sp. HK-II TaxID=2009266 RepID=UPI000E2F5F8F|nr:DEAD/DEAH box helicase [Nitratidesulfovibrio sp. HK-II]GBO97227.1 superfamily II DNA and RNA helicases [Nitratidesulfovibrio sp. HK-II]